LSNLYVLRAKCCTDAGQNAFLGEATDGTLAIGWRAVPVAHCAR
jgi:hypothetical protein